MIKSVITGVNDNFHYLKYTKVFKSAWKYFFEDISLYCCYTGNNSDIKDFLNSQFDHVFHLPNDNFKESVYAAQSARAYCASLVEEVGLCITTDIDLIPLSSEYFNKGAENSNPDEFLIYRNVLLDIHQIAISYCAAFPSTWREITQISTLSEAIERIQSDHLKIQADGIKGGEGWFYDQVNLFDIVIRSQELWDPKNNRVRVLDDTKLRFSRLDRALLNSKEIFFNNPLDLLAQNFSDYHLPEIEVDEIPEWEIKFTHNIPPLAYTTPNYFATEFSKRLESSLQEIKVNKRDWRALFNLSKLRDEFARFCLDPKNKVENIADHEELLKIYTAFIDTQVNYLNDKLNVAFKNYWANKKTNGISGISDISSQIELLFIKPHLVKRSKYLQTFNNRFQYAYNRFIFLPPIFFEDINERNLYLNYFKQLITELIEYAKSQKLELFQALAIDFLNTTSIIPLYFSDSALTDVMKSRASIIEIIVSAFSGSPPLDYSFAPRKSGKIKVGVLAAHFKEQTETYATLPSYEYINKDVFNITLISQLPFTNTAIETKCLNSASDAMTLTGNIAEDIQNIRARDFDILWIGTNVTAVLNYVTQISAFRLARHQILSGCCPVTSGFKNVDYFVSGDLTETPNAQNDYTEKLLLVKGTAHCFTFEDNALNFKKSKVEIRKKFNIPTEATIFTSGANFYKLTPELLDIWLEILKQTQNSYLFLYPFNPNWTNNYPTNYFLFYLEELLLKHNVHRSRIIIHDPFKHKNELLQTIAECDVYLDSFPYSGMTSILDPIKVNLPMISLEGKFQRERMSSSSLNSLGLIDWVTENAAAYVSKAVYLHHSKTARETMKKQLEQSLLKIPPFMDSASFSKEVGNIFSKLTLTK